MQELIDKLRLVDGRFAEAGWLPEYVYRALLAEVIDELQQKCEQTPCPTLRELLAQKHTEEFDAFSHATEDDEMKKHTANMKAIQAVLELISEPKPVS